jgi:hypothetical protein
VELLKWVRAGVGLFWLIIGTALFVTGVVLSVGALLGGYDHEWYVGPC